MVNIIFPDGTTLATVIANLNVFTSNPGTSEGEGEIIYNSTDNKVYSNIGTAGSPNWSDISGSGGVTDHGALTGLADDDHTQYLLVDGTRSMTGNLTTSGHLIIDTYVAGETLNTSDSTDQVWLLCANTGGDNECIGNFICQRSSGHWDAINLDVIISTGSTAQVYGFIGCNQQLGTAASNSFSLITCTYNSISYVALRYVGDAHSFTNPMYFTGLTRCSVADKFKNLSTSGVTDVTDLPKTASKVTFMPALFGIGTTTPTEMLEVAGKIKALYGTGINEFSIDSTLTGNSDDAIPTEQAVKTYIDNNAGTNNTSFTLDQDGAGTSTSFQFNTGGNVSLSQLNGTVTLDIPEFDRFYIDINGTTEYFFNEDELDMHSNKITNLLAGAANGDAIRYEQLIGQYLQLSGGTLSGTLGMDGNNITSIGSISFGAAPIIAIPDTGEILFKALTTSMFGMTKILNTSYVPLDMDANKIYFYKGASDAASAYIYADSNHDLVLHTPTAGKIKMEVGA